MSPPVPFDAAHAEVYDQQFAGMSALKDALHLVVESQLSELPPAAHLLVVGAGTGAEVRHLARVFPGWRFTLVDPSAPMLAVARRHAEAEGFADRCRFHADVLGTLDAAGFDGATSLLTSHFLTDAQARRGYFRDIADRLVPGAPLLNADLCADRGAPAFTAVMDLWLHMLGHAVGLPEERRTAYRGMFGQAFAAHGPAEVEAMMVDAGFDPPAPCFQVALVRGWIARRARA